VGGRPDVDDLDLAGFALERHAIFHRFHLQRFAVVCGPAHDRFVRGGRDQCRAFRLVGGDPHDMVEVMVREHGVLDGFLTNDLAQ